MITEQYQFERLSSKEGFNKSLLHFKAVSGLLGDFENYINLADLVRDSIDEKAIKPSQIGAIVHALLVDKYGYSYRSVNLSKTLEDFSYIAEETKKWKAVDLVLTYNHPELGLQMINPKNPEHWQSMNQLKKDELIVVYAGGFQDAVKESAARTALDTLIGYLEGRKRKASSALSKGKYSFKAPPVKEKMETKSSSGGRKKSSSKKAAPAPKRQKAVPDKDEEKREEVKKAEPRVQSSGSRKMTPMYSVPVTNELFHNGNVEAWKRIIHSYQAKHPDCDVFIFYDGERIHDINTLFKWGKVKHGSAILFAIVGETIQDVAKLQRYLKQGASPRFEDFLRFPVNQVLNLF